MTSHDGWDRPRNRKGRFTDEDDIATTDEVERALSSALAARASNMGDQHHIDREDHRLDLALGGRSITLLTLIEPGPSARDGAS